MFDFFLGIFLFLSPIFLLFKPIGNINALQFYQFGILGNTGYNYLQLQFFCFGVVGLFIAALFSKPQREFNNRWIAILLGLFCLNVYLHPIGIKMLAPIFLGFLLCYLVAVYTKDYKKLFQFIFLASLLNTAFAILQFFNINLIYQSTNRIDGLMGISTHLGAYQVIALPICYAIHPILIIVPIVGIILSKSITAIVIMLVWLLIKSFMGIRTKKGILNIISYPFTMALFSLLIFYITHNWSSILQKINIRLIVWLPTIKEIFRDWNWLYGIGLKPFKFNSPIGLYENPCSVYIEAIHYLGILVLIPIFMIIRKIIAFKNNILSQSLLIALLIGIEKSFFDYPRLAGTVIPLFAFLEISKRKENLC